MIPKNNCLDCNIVLWDNNPLTQPKKGYYSICCYCGSIMIFSKNLKLIRPKKIPNDIKAKSLLVKIALAHNISVEQVMKDILIREGHIHSH